MYPMPWREDIRTGQSNKVQVIESMLERKQQFDNKDKFATADWGYIWQRKGIDIPWKSTRIDTQ